MRDEPASGAIEATARISLLLKECVECFSRVIGRLCSRTHSLVGGQIRYHFRNEGRADVSGVLRRDAGRNLLALTAFPARHRVEVPAVRAGMEIGTAFSARRVEFELDGTERAVRISATGALEGLGSEAARAATARCSLHSLRTELARGITGWRIGLRTGVLITLVTVLTIAQ